MRHVVLLPLLFSVLSLAYAADDNLEALEKRVFTDEAGKTLPYRLLKPRNYDPQKHYPLVLFMHGAGERGTDNNAQLVHGVSAFLKDEQREKFPCFLLAPQCPKERKWVEVSWSTEAHTMPEKPSEPLRLAMGALEALRKEFKLDEKRIYVSGLSMGGFGTWDAIARYPNVFAAAVPVCGGGDEKTAATIVNLPIWVFHGSDDGVVKTIRSRNMVEALKKAGGAPKYTEYPKVGHNAWSPAYKEPELIPWMFAQAKK